MLKDLLVSKKSLIVDKWIGLILETYPSNGSKFLRLQKDRFSNPVGYTISNSAEKIFEEIISDRDIEKIKIFLNDIIKIRAVQNFSPSLAAGFIYLLKKVIRQELNPELIDGKVLKELFEFESSLDDLALIAFDLYMDAKEKIFKIRVNEIKSKDGMRRNGVMEE